MKKVSILIIASIAVFLYFSNFTYSRKSIGYRESLSFMKDILNYKKKGGYEKLIEIEKCLFVVESRFKSKTRNFRTNSKSESLVYFRDLDPNKIKIYRKEYGITIIIHLKNNMSYVEYVNTDYESGEKKYRENDFIVFSPLFFPKKEEIFVLAHINNLILECKGIPDYKD